MCGCPAEAAERGARRERCFVRETPLEGGGKLWIGLEKEAGTNPRSMQTADVGPRRRPWVQDGGRGSKTAAVGPSRRPWVQDGGRGSEPAAVGPS